MEKKTERQIKDAVGSIGQLGVGATFIFATFVRSLAKVPSGPALKVAEDLCKK